MEREEEEGTRTERKTVVKLRCPAAAAAAAVPWVAREDQRLDLGSIARFFGLNPATLKLNGHFIARGIHLDAASVTWKSLLSFFSARGLPAGTRDADAIVVDGKLRKPGTKREHDPFVHGNHDDVCTCGSSQPEDIGSCKKKKMCKDTSGNKINICNRVSLKRKQWLQEIIQLKRLKIHEQKTDLEGPKDDNSGPILKAQFPCSYARTTENMKRIRENDVVTADPCKRTC